jgi:uncharacterized protein YbjT (DUF2867 family)
MERPAARQVFVAGGTGYLGRALLPRLLAGGHRVRALVRPGSAGRLAPGCEAVRGSALDAASYRQAIPPCDTFVHLVGVAHPAPWKAAQFEAVDLAAVRASLQAVAGGGVRHFVYLSVAHPAPVMQAYWRVRARCEALIDAAGLDRTFARPWYVLGPGHRWPHLLRPLYALAEALPASRETARRLGLVTLAQMTAALVRAIEEPPAGRRVLEVPALRAGG